MCVHIDPTGGHDGAISVDNSISGQSFADCGDDAIVNGNVTVTSHCPRAIKDGAARDYYLVLSHGRDTSPSARSLE